MIVPPRKYGTWKPPVKSYSAISRLLFAYPPLSSLLISPAGGRRNHIFHPVTGEWFRRWINPQLAIPTIQNCKFWLFGDYARTLHYQLSHVEDEGGEDCTRGNLTQRHIVCFEMKEHVEEVFFWSCFLPPSVISHTHPKPQTQLHAHDDNTDN